MESAFVCPARETRQLIVKSLTSAFPFCRHRSLHRIPGAFQGTLTPAEKAQLALCSFVLDKQPYLRVLRTRWVTCTSYSLTPSHAA